MDKGNKVKTTDMTTLQSDLVTIATGMKRNTVLEEADHVEKATYTGKILATDIQNIRAAINGLEAESSGTAVNPTAVRPVRDVRARAVSQVPVRVAKAVKRAKVPAMSES